jgi:hypothetical protein
MRWRTLMPTLAMAVFRMVCAQPSGIDVPKIALLGKIFVNGYLFGGCEHGELKDPRCLHHPCLFEIAPV